MVILWFILLVLLAILFVPVNYRVLWTRDKPDTGHTLTLKAGWFFNILLIEVLVNSEKESGMFLSIFGIKKTLHPEPEKKEEEKKKKAREKPDTPKKKYRIAKKRLNRLRSYFNLHEVKYIFQKTLKRLWRMFSPSYFHLNAVCGTGNPMYTGLLVGLYYSLGVYRISSVHLQPDYTRATVYGKANITGYLSIGSVLGNLIIIIFTIILIGIRHKLRVIFYNILPGKIAIFRK